MTNTPSRTEIIGWRPLPLTNARVILISETTGFDPLSLEGLRLMRNSGFAAQLKICHAMLSPELDKRGMSRDDYVNAFESMEEVKPVYLASMQVIGNFFQSHAPKEMWSAMADLITILGGTGAKSTGSQPSPESKSLDDSASGS